MDGILGGLHCGQTLAAPTGSSGPIRRAAHAGVAELPARRAPRDWEPLRRIASDNHHTAWLVSAVAGTRTEARDGHIDGKDPWPKTGVDEF